MFRDAIYCACDCEFAAQHDVLSNLPIFASSRKRSPGNTDQSLTLWLDLPIYEQTRPSTMMLAEIMSVALRSIRHVSRRPKPRSNKCSVDALLKLSSREVALGVHNIGDKYDGNLHQERPGLHPQADQD